MVDISCIAASIIPIEIRKSRKGYQVKKASWQDFFLGYLILTARINIDIMDPGHQIEVACPKDLRNYWIWEGIINRLEKCVRWASG